MDFKAKAVACAMPVDRQITGANHISCSGIDLDHSDASLNLFYRRRLSQLHRVVRSFIQGGWPANGKTPGYIAAIAFVLSPEINQYSIYLPELSRCRLMMRPRGVWTEGNNRIEANFCP